MTRPISLSDTASKFFALAVKYPLSQVAMVTVYPRQRGFVGDRSITDNVIEIEGFGQSYAPRSSSSTSGRRSRQLHTNGCSLFLAA